MALIKVTDAQGVILDWLVGVAEGDRVFRLRIGRPTNWKGVEVEPDAWEPRAQVPDVGWFADFTYNPSVNWAQGGPIKEREGINDFRYNKIDPNEPDRWCAHKVVPRPNMEGSTNMVAIALDGPTPLIAAMRCFCCSKLGDIVEVPEELCEA